jgi:hypothetical protein
MTRRRHDCGECTDRIMDLVGGELTSLEEHELMGEVQACPTCAAELIALHSTRTLFKRSVESARPTDEYWSRYEQRMRLRIMETENEAGSLAARRWRFRDWNYQLVAAAVVVVAVLAVLMSYRRDRRGAQTTVVNSSVAPAIVSSSPGPAARSTRNAMRSHSGKRNSQTHTIEAAGFRKPEPSPGLEVSALIAPSPWPVLLKTHAEQVSVFFNSVLHDRELGTISRRQARLLLSRNQFFRREAEARGDVLEQDGLSRLEPVLLDITHADDTGTVGVSGELRERIRDKDSLLKELAATFAEESFQ